MRTKSRTQALLSVLALVALFLGATGLVSAQTPTFSYTDYGTGYNSIVNLTTEGPLDWLQCGVNSGTTTVNHKTPGTSPLITVAVLPSVSAATGWFSTFWQDGIPGSINTATGDNQTNKFQNCSSVTWTVPVDASGGTRVLKLWMHNNNSGTSGLTARIGAGPLTTLWASGSGPAGAAGGNGNFYGQVRIVYASPTPADVMTVTWTGSGSTLQVAGAALAAAAAPAFVSNPFSMPEATVGNAYVFTLAKQALSSSAGALTFSKTAGPAWLTVAANGALTGTPAAGDVGTNAFSVQVTDATSALSGTATMNIVVNPSGSAVTKVAFIRDRQPGGYDLSAYKAFLENTVYPGRTMVYYDTPSRYTYANFDANKAELVDSDLIIFTNDLTSNYYDWQQWNQLNVPIMMHNQQPAATLLYNPGNYAYSLGWMNGNSTWSLRWGPNGYTNTVGNLGWMYMYHTAGPTAGVPRYYTPNAIDPFYAGIPTTPYPVGDNLINPTHYGPQFGDSGYNIATKTSSDNLLPGQWYNTGVWFQVYAGQKLVGTTTNYDTGGGKILGLAQDASNPQGNDWYNRGIGYQPSLVRWNQGDLLYRWNVPAPSRRFFFPSGYTQTIDEMTSMFEDPAGSPLTPLGQTLLKNALTGLYDPANGRRPIPVAGAAATVFFVGAETQHAYTIPDATYNNGGDGAATGTYSWTVVATVPANQSSVSITANGTTLAPTITFGKTGLYTATLKAVKSAQLDAVSSSKIITVVAAAPTITYTWPSNGLAIETLTGKPVVITFNQPVAIAAPPLMLTVNGSIVACTDSGDHMTFTCNAIALGAALPVTSNTAIPFSLATSQVTSLANGTAFSGATYTWNAVFNAAAHASFRIVVLNGFQNGVAYTGPLNPILQSVFGPYSDIQWLTTYGATGVPVTQAVYDQCNAADLVIMGADASQSSFGPTTGWGPGGTTDIAQLNTPVMIMRCLILQQACFASNTSAVWANAERCNPLYAIDTSTPLFAGVSVIPSYAATIPMMASNLCWWKYPTNPNDSFELFAGNVAQQGLQMGSSSYFYPSSVNAVYWPRLTPLYPASTITHVARRSFWGIGHFNYIPTYTADGITAFKNMLLLTAPLPAAPTVVSTTPGATATAKVLTASVTFNLGTTMPGALTITGVGAGPYTNPTASNENRTWTYTIPAADMIGKLAQTLHFSVNMTGVTETESGLATPYVGANPYTWDSAYDPGTLGIKVLVLREDHGSAAPNEANYRAFVQGIYGAGSTVTILARGAAETGDSMDQAAGYSTVLTSKIAAADMVIFDGRIWEGSMYSPRWPTLATYTKPILEGRGYLYNVGAAATNWWSLNTQGVGSSRFEQINAAVPTSPLFAGVNTAGPITVFSSAVPTGNRETANFGNSLTGVLAYPQSTTNEVVASFSPAGSPVRSNSTLIHQANRAFFPIHRIDEFNLLTADGLKMLGNMLKMLRPVDGPPSVASTIPGATVTAAINTVSVVFDRAVTTPGALTMKDVTDTVTYAIVPPASASSADGGVTWVYPIPAGTMNGKLAQSLHFSVVTTGVIETLSGLQLPYAGPNPFTWSSAYDPGQLGIKILGFMTSWSSTLAGRTNFDNFARTVYGPSTTVNWLDDTAWCRNQVGMTALRAMIPSYDLLAFDHGPEGWRTASDSGWWVYAGTSNGGPYPTGIIETLTKPIISFNMNGFQSLQGCDGGGGDRNGVTQFLASNLTSPIFNGVTIPGNKLITVFSPAVNGAQADYYSTPNPSAFIASTTDADPKNCAIAVFPAGSQASTGGIVHPARVGTFQLGTFDNMPSLTADGRTLLANTLKAIRPLSAPPVVVSTIPGAVAAASIVTVSVVFDQTVSIPGTLTMKDGTNTTIATVTTPASADGGRTWVYAIPAGTLVGKPSQTFHFSVVMTGVFETVSGVQLPYLGANPYTWDTAYDVTKLTSIVFCTNKAAGMGTGGYYDTFLQSVYPNATVTFMPAGAFQANPWSAATLGAMQAATLVIMDVNSNDAGTMYANPQWNTLTTPLLSFGDRFLRDAGTGMEPTGVNDYNWCGGAYWVTNRDTLLYQGTTVNSDGTFTIMPDGRNMDILTYGTSAAPTYGGTCYMTNWSDHLERATLIYWPANTTFYTGGKSAAGRRMAWMVDDGYGGNSRIVSGNFTANGIQMTKNVLRWMAAPVGPPVIVSTDPGATVLNPIATVTVTFDRHVTQPGALTIKDGTLATMVTIPTPTAGAEGGIRWTYTVPAGTFTGKLAQTFTFSMVTTGLVETESGLQLPFAGGNPYVWTSAYNPGQLGIKLLVLRENHQGAAPTNEADYTTFIKGIYGPGATVTFIARGDAAIGGDSMNQATGYSTVLTNMINASDMVIADGQLWEGALYNGRWPDLATYTRPVLQARGYLYNVGAAANWWSVNSTGIDNNNVKIEQITASSPTSPLFAGVNTAGPITIFSSLLSSGNRETANVSNSFTNALASPTVASGQVIASFSQAGTAVRSTSTLLHAGNRAWFAPHRVYDFNYLTADGRTILKNMLLMLRSLDAAPVVLSVSPASGSLFTTSVPSVITVTFDRPVTGVTTITVNGNLVGSPVGSLGNSVWTWNVPPALLPNVPGTVSVSMIKTGIYETQSAVQLPLGTGTLDWSFTFDKSQYHPTVAFVSNPAGGDDHSAYASFLVNDVYSTTLYNRATVIEDVPGKYYNLTTSGALSMQGTLSLVIVLPFQDNPSLTAPAPAWNGMKVPIMNHKSTTAVGWGWNYAAGTTALDKENWSASRTPIYMWTAIPNDFFLNGNTGGILGAYGGTISTVGFWNVIEPWSFETISSNSGEYGTGVPLSSPADYHNQTWALRWDVGNTFRNAKAAPARTIFQTMGQSTAANNFGQDSIATFFDPVNGAADTGAKQILRNELRWLMNPDAMPFALSVKSASPTMGGGAGVLGPITVTFSKAVGSPSGVGNPLPGDLTWTATLSGVTYKNPASSPLITVIPIGTPPTAQWQFDGPWETNNALIGQFQPIAITLNGMDTPSHSHIMSVDGDGCPLTSWTWNYQWTPVPASVSNKLWSLYE